MQSSQRSSGKQKRVSLSKHRTEIEQWVEQGNSDDWIAHALGTSRASVQSFRSRHGILRRGHEGRSPRKREASASEPVSTYEGVLDQGEEGYGLWLDPAVADDPLFQAGFAGVSEVRVVIQESRIILEPAAPEPRTGSEEPADEGRVGEWSADWQATTNGAGFFAEQATVPTSSSGEPGRVKFFDADKGYGFIIRPDGGDIFFHRSEIQNAEELEAGEYIFYEPGSSPRGPVAQRVRAVG